MDDPTDTGLAIGGLAVLGLSLTCCIICLFYDVGCCRKSQSKSEVLLNDGTDILSEVTVE